MAGSRPRAASLVATPLWLEKSHAKPAPSVGVGSARGGCRSPSENASSLPCFTGLCRRPSVARRLGRLSVTSRPDQKDSMATTYTRIQYGSARERKRGHACGTARSIPVSTLEHRSGAHDIPANDNWMFTAFGCITRYGPVPQSVQKCLRSSGTAKMVSTSPLPPGWVHPAYCNPAGRTLLRVEAILQNDKTTCRSCVLGKTTALTRKVSDTNLHSKEPDVSSPMLRYTTKISKGDQSRKTRLYVVVDFKLNIGWHYAVTLENTL